MVKKQNPVYPIIIQKNIDKLIKTLKLPGKIDVESTEVNKDDLALEIILNHKDNGLLDHEGIDWLLEIVGFEYKPCRELDKIYGRNTKYYLFKSKGKVWIAYGENGYASDWTRISVNWGEKIDRKLQKELCM